MFHLVHNFLPSAQMFVCDDSNTDESILTLNYVEKYLFFTFLFF